MSVNIFIVCVCCVFVPHVWSANILLVGLTISHSHHFWIEPIGLELVNQGHNVTFLSLDPTKVARENYTVLTLNGAYEKFYSDFELSDFQSTLTWSSMPFMVDQWWRMMLLICEDNINHPNLHKLLQYPQDHFNLILWDHTMGECLYPLIAHFGNPPVIGLSPLGLTDSINHLYKGSVYPYVGTVSLPFAEARTLNERLFNTAYILYNTYRRDTLYKDASVELSRKVFPNWNERNYEAIEDDFNLVLINWNVAVNQPQPLSLNMIPIGGVQIKTGETLSKDVLNIFKRSSSGVIFFSLGSNFKSEDLPTDILQPIVDCFTELETYEFIWKIDHSNRLKLPKNVHTVVFAQQAAILEQDKTKLFITHGGGLSTQETSYFGVPIVGVPLFLDQINNVEKLRLRGGAESVTLEDIQLSRVNVFCAKIKQVLREQSYTDVMKNISMRYQDRESHPMKTTLYWVEYMLRHGNAKHLRPLSYNMNVFYSQNLDIYSILLLLLSTIIFCVILVFRCCCRRFSRINITTERKKTN